MSDDFFFDPTIAVLDNTPIPTRLREIASDDLTSNERARRFADLWRRRRLSFSPTDRSELFTRGVLLLGRVHGSAGEVLETALNEVALLNSEGIREKQLEMDDAQLFLLALAHGGARNTELFTNTGMELHGLKAGTTSGAERREQIQEEIALLVRKSRKRVRRFSNALVEMDSPDADLLTRIVRQAAPLQAHLSHRGSIELISCLSSAIELGFSLLREMSIRHILRFLRGLTLLKRLTEKNLCCIGRELMARLEAGLHESEARPRLRELHRIADAWTDAAKTIRHRNTNDCSTTSQLFERIGDVAAETVEELYPNSDSDGTSVLGDRTLAKLLRKFSAVGAVHRQLFKWANQRLNAELEQLRQAQDASSRVRTRGTNLYPYAEIGDDAEVVVSSVDAVSPSVPSTRESTRPGVQEGCLLDFASAFFRRPKNDDQRFTPTAKELLKWAAQNAYSLPESTRASLLWLLSGRKGYFDDELFRGIFQRISSSMSTSTSIRTDPKVRTNTVRAFAHVNLFDSSIFEGVRKTSVRDIHGFLNFDLQILAWAFAVSGDENEEALFARILQTAHGRLRRKPLFHQYSEADYLGPDYWTAILWSATCVAPRLVPSYLEKSWNFLDQHEREISGRSLGRLQTVLAVLRLQDEAPRRIKRKLAARRRELREKPPSPSQAARRLADRIKEIRPDWELELEVFHEASGQHVDILAHCGEEELAIECDGPQNHPFTRDLHGRKLRTPGPGRLNDRAVRRYTDLVRVPLKDWEAAEGQGTGDEYLQSLLTRHP